MIGTGAFERTGLPSRALGEELRTLWVVAASATSDAPSANRVCPIVQPLEAAPKAITKNATIAPAPLHRSAMSRLLDPREGKSAARPEERRNGRPARQREAR